VTRKQIIAAAFLWLILPLNSSACSCVASSVKERFEKASHVFIGVVESARIGRNLPADVKMEGSVVGRVSVIDTFKGSPQALDYLITMPNSAACGIPMPPSKTYLFFVREIKIKGKFFWKLTYGFVNLCDGTVPAYGVTGRMIVEELERLIE